MTVPFVVSRRQFTRSPNPRQPYRLARAFQFGRFQVDQTRR